MNENKNIIDDDGQSAVGIAAQSLPATVNSLLDGAGFWSLRAGGIGSANFEAAWEYATGQGVLVGIVDEGVNYTHLDLVGNYATDLDFDPRDNISEIDALPDSPGEQHGTKVAGIIAGSMDNTIGGVGAAPDATITASYLRFGSSMDVSELVQVLSQQARFDVANNSWGFTSAFADNFHEAYLADFAAQLETAAADGRGGLGTAVVVGAGNGKFLVDGSNIGDESNFHNFSNSRFVIAVGAHDANGDAAAFSSPGTNLLISAPGVGLVTTGGNAIDSQDWSYVSGTSFAAPLVSSAIALMLEVNPELGYRDIQEILAITASPSRSDQATTNGAANVNGGGMVFDREMGFGTLDAEAAVKLARHWTQQSTAANEEHLAAAFDLPPEFDGLGQSLFVTIDNPGADGFSADFVELTLEVVDVDLKHLKIELISPDGTNALIAPNLSAVGGKTYLNFTFSSVVTWGENPFGTWTLRLSHPEASGEFAVHDARIDIYGDSKGTDDTHYFTSAFDRLVADDPTRSVVADRNGGLDTLNFAAAKGSLILDLVGLRSNSLGSTSFDVDGNFENAVGTSSDDTILGTNAANSLNGDFGNDILIGRDGDDILVGDKGHDLLNGGRGGDLLDGGSGIDIVDYSTATEAVEIDLRSGAHGGDAAGDVFVSIEQFQLSAHADYFRASSSDITPHIILGNAGNDILCGGAGADWLDGGTGDDRLYGSTGDDVYVVDSVGDRIFEAVGSGFDTIYSSVNISLPSNVEKLILTGNRAANVLANSLDNWIAGNMGANILNGGVGADRLIGGGGNDIYNVDNSRDAVTELVGQGTDTIYATANYVLPTHVENLVLTGRAYNGTGNSGSNLLSGNDAVNQLDGAAGNDKVYGFSGNDVLKGGLGNDLVSGGNGNDRIFGGFGNDVLIGGAGYDIFVFDSAFSSANRDTITDFYAPQDTFQLENAFFTKLGAGVHVLNPGYFRAGPVAQDANDHIIYNKATGALSYDMNGSGAGGVIHLATLSNKPVLTASDFVVI